MGIPHLFRCLSRAHPSAVARGAKVQGGCDKLYVDFNAVVHMCARETMDLLPDEGGLEAAIIAASIVHLQHVVGRAGPRSEVFVAVDGRPPRAKMHQQRCRRYMTAYSGPSEVKWDTNAITPGTRFMDKLAVALHSFAQTELGPMRYVVSDSRTPGEGEQKIFERIRSMGDHDAVDCVVHGMDADLLLMGMLLPPGPRQRLRIMREQELRGELQVVNVGRLSALVAADIDPKGDPSLGLRDFVALCMLLGNDFIPGLPGLFIADGGVNALLSVYHSTLGGGRRLATGGPEALGGVDPVALRDVVGALAAKEDAAMAHADFHYYQRCARAQSARSKKGAKGAKGGDPDDYPLLNPTPRLVRPGAVGWRPRYYRHLLGLGPDEVGELALRYAAGVGWSLAYMGQRLLSSGFLYGHAYGPTAVDLHRFLVTPDLVALVAQELEDAEREWTTAAVDQLTAVLPPSSLAALAPDLYARAMEAAPHAFPTGFRIATYLRTRLWECQPILPPVPLHSV